jgi:hypothetical protein
VIRVYDEAGNVIEKGDVSWDKAPFDTFLKPGSKTVLR